MFEHAPLERPWVSWLYVVLWSLVIFVTIPLARSLQQFVYKAWGRQVFTYAVIVVIVFALAVAIIYLYRKRTPFSWSYLWLLAVAIIFFGYTVKLGKKSPEEAIHFIQYGFLGILVFRALAHRLHDSSIYFAATIVCAIIGTIDEVIQWLTPRRYWGIEDVWLNFFAALSVQVAIWKGMRPHHISGRPSLNNIQFLCRLAIVAVVLFGICLLNTPSRMIWCAERVPGLTFPKKNESMMQEYGYLIEDPDIGIFRSRLSPKKLKAADRERSVAAARILDQFQDRAAYSRFLAIYTPISDPFLHEARVHLFRRDVHYLKGMDVRDDPEEMSGYLTIAFHENQILEKYFTHTLHRSAYVWSPDQVALCQEHLLSDRIYESSVSRGLFTQFSEFQIAAFFSLMIIGLIGLHAYLGRRLE